LSVVRYSDTSQFGHSSSNFRWYACYSDLSEVSLVLHSINILHFIHSYYVYVPPWLPNGITQITIMEVDKSLQTTNNLFTA